MAAKQGRSPKGNSNRGFERGTRQGGGTVLGVVLGLIVGLAIAVVVALYITRSPSPFVAKNAPAQASDTTGNAQPYDPNRPLQGKSPGQPVPQAAQPAPPNTAPGQTNSQSQSSGLLDEPQIVEVPPFEPVAPAPVTPAPRTSGGPDATHNAPPSVGGTSKAQATAPSASAANTGYFLQVGAYKTTQDAEQQRARLALQGFEAKVTRRNSGNATYFRVRLGPFNKFDDMNNVRQRLSDGGIDTAVIRFTKQ